MPHIKLLLIAAAILASGAYAQQSVGEDSIRQLSRCDSGFFRSLATMRSQFEGYAKLTGNSLPAFSVPERRHPTESRVMFSKPLNVAGLDVVGYYDEIADFRAGMSGYSWGYLVAGSVEATANAFRPYIWEADRLRKDDPVYVRSEVWSHTRPADGWAKIKTESGLPKPGTIERVLLIEPYDGETKFIRFGCSLQGNVTDPIIRELRPDLRQ